MFSTRHTLKPLLLIKKTNKKHCNKGIKVKTITAEEKKKIPYEKEKQIHTNMFILNFFKPL